MQRRAVVLLHDGVMGSLDFTALDADAMLIASYPRPNHPTSENENAPSSIINLWRLDKRD